MDLQKIENHMYKLDILTNPAGNSEGLDRKMEIPNGRGVCDYGNPRAWGDNAFWKFQRQGGLKYASRLWYGMDIFWNRPVQQEREKLKHLHIFTMFDFSEHQILQVLENVASIFTLSDIYKSVEVWDKSHTQKILSVISSVFEDVSCDKDWNDTHFDSNHEFDNEFLDEWDQ